MKINEFEKLNAYLRMVEFESIKAIGIFWLIERLGLKIKEPFNTLYQRSKRNKAKWKKT